MSILADIIEIAFNVCTGNLPFQQSGCTGAPVQPDCHQFHHPKCPGKNFPLEFITPNVQPAEKSIKILCNPMKFQKIADTEFRFKKVT